MAETPVVIFKRRGAPQSWTLEHYLDTDGYKGLRKAVTEMTPQEVIETVEASGLRGRGGAGIPDRTQVVAHPEGLAEAALRRRNGDEGEPGAFHDRELMETDPHALLEGMPIAVVRHRREARLHLLPRRVLLAHERLEAAIREAYEDGYLGDNIFGTDFSCESSSTAVPAAYICGEETALLESLEGYRGMPRPRPPFPAVEGLVRIPTVVNNTQTLMNARTDRAQRRRVVPQWGTEKSPGTAVVSVSGAVRNPRNFEVPMGTTVRECLELAGGVDDRGLKAFAPVARRRRCCLRGHLDAGDGLRVAGRRGFGARRDGDHRRSRRRCASCARSDAGWSFYEHESCGKCTPCREGTYWVEHVLERIEAGRGRPATSTCSTKINEQHGRLQVIVRAGGFRRRAGGVLASSASATSTSEHVRRRRVSLSRTASAVMTHDRANRSRSRSTARPIECQPGELLIEAAERAGIYIPCFCYHQRMDPVGACRMCLVDVESPPTRARRPQTSCTTVVADGMVVETQFTTERDPEGAGRRSSSSC